MEISQRQAEICAALGDIHRVLLLYMVADGPHSVTDLVKRVGLSQPAVSRHLRIMRECGIVAPERRGKSTYYFLVDPRIIEAMDLLRTVLTERMQKQGDLAQSASYRPSI